MAPAQVAGDGVGRPGPLIECVPNVSEGRDPTVIRHLADSVERGGAHLVDVHSDVDHHRSVFTFMGPADVVERSLLELTRFDVLRTKRPLGSRRGELFGTTNRAT